MAKNFFQPIRMESQFVPTKLLTVKVWDSFETQACNDGDIVTVGRFAPEEIYSKAFSYATGSVVYVNDLNTRYAELATSGATDICVIDLASTETVSGNGRTYRIGANTIGLVAEPNVPVRARKLVEDDFFVTGADNIDNPPTIFQFVEVGNNGKWTPVATAPTSGAYCEVIDEVDITEGVDVTTKGYRLLVKNNH